jgi:HK97 family phage major capsid protein
MPTDLLTETPIEADPFAPATRSNPGGTMYREVTIEREAGQPEAALRVAISSEAAVLRYDWRTDEEYLEVLDHGPEGPDLSYAQDGLPFLRDHRLGDQIGLLQDVSLDADRRLRGTLAQGNHPDAAWLFADMRSGVRKKVSIGYWPGSTYTQEKNAAGQLVRRYRGWMIYEASTVTVPADYDVGVGRGAPGRAPTPSDIPAVADEAPKKERSMAVDNASERGVAPAPDTRPEQLAVLAREGGLTERLADWISNGVTVEQARTEVIRTLREKVAPAVVAPAPVIEVGADRAAAKPWAADGGDFFRAVVSAGRGGELDPRLKADRAQNTLLGEEGGFAIPAPVVNTFLEATMTGGELLGRVAGRPVTNGNSYVETVTKEEARTNGSRNGGVRGYWVAEDNTVTESQAATRQVDLKLQKVAALVKLTEEQTEDGPALVSFLNEQVPEELRFMAEQAIWEGSGVGQPLGALNSGALVTVAIEGSQTIANTAGNIWVNAAKMYSRMPARMLNGSAFFINQELWAKILTATAGTTQPAAPMFTPPGQLASTPNGAIYGRPIVPIEYASAEGTVGDFVFANFSDYLFIQKGGIKQSASMHVEFARDRQVLKFTWRVNGAPRTRVPLTPFKGSSTVSPYIALAARS